MMLSCTGSLVLQSDAVCAELLILLFRGANTCSNAGERITLRCTEKSQLYLMFLKHTEMCPGHTDVSLQQIIDTI